MYQTKCISKRLDNQHEYLIHFCLNYYKYKFIQKFSQYHYRSDSSNDLVTHKTRSHWCCFSSAHALWQVKNQEAKAIQVIPFGNANYITNITELLLINIPWYIIIILAISNTMSILWRTIVASIISIMQYSLERLRIISTTHSDPS